MTEIPTPIYPGKPEDFHYAGFGSGSGTNLFECNKLLKMDLILTDRPGAKLLSIPKFASIEKIILNGFREHDRMKLSEIQDNPAKLQEYEDHAMRFNYKIVDMLHEFEQKKGYRLDLIVLGGYMRIVKEPLLEAYENRIINVHPAPLDIIYFDKDAKPKRDFIGEGYDVVLKAVLRHIVYTKSSVFVVDGGMDHGEIITQGPDYKIDRQSLYSEMFKNPITGNVLKEFVEKTQDTLKETSDWPALTTAVKLISEGRISIGTEKIFHTEWRQIYVDGKPMPYAGFQVKKI